MMRPQDYAVDLRDCLIRRQPWHGSEIEGLAQRFRAAPRCYLGLHYPTYGDRSWSYYEPPEEGWFCNYCAKETPGPVNLLRWRIADFYYEHFWRAPKDEQP